MQIIIRLDCFSPTKNKSSFKTTGLTGIFKDFFLTFLEKTGLGYDNVPVLQTE